MKLCEHFLFRGQSRARIRDPLEGKVYVTIGVGGLDNKGTCFGFCFFLFLGSGITVLQVSEKNLRQSSEHSGA